MKSKNQIGRVILFIVLLVACNLSSYPQLNDTARYNIIKRALERSRLTSHNNYNDEGRPIDMHIAQRCIKLFKPEMLKHRIMDTKSRKLSPQRTMIVPRMITTAEVFGGTGLLDWIAETINKLDSTGGNNVGIKLAYGIYTEELLNTLREFGNDSTEIAKRRNRITIFLIPCDKNEIGQRLILYSSRYMKKELHNKNQIIENSKAYELGGLEP